CDQGAAFVGLELHDSYVQACLLGDCAQSVQGVVTQMACRRGDHHDRHDAGLGRQRLLLRDSAGAVPDVIVDRSDHRTSPAWR
ncbi:MAG: hypothetical protein B7X41_07625, partial [Microbacterium sp. 14-71-5]